MLFVCLQNSCKTQLVCTSDAHNERNGLRHGVCYYFCTSYAFYIEHTRRKVMCCCRIYFTRYTDMNTKLTRALRCISVTLLYCFTNRTLRGMRELSYPHSDWSVHTNRRLQLQFHLPACQYCVASSRGHVCCKSNTCTHLSMLVVMNEVRNGCLLWFVGGLMIMVVIIYAFVPKPSIICSVNIVYSSLISNLYVQ